MKFDIVEFHEKLLKHFNLHLDGAVFTATLLSRPTCISVCIWHVT
jgi:hypothetical protein